MLLAAPAAAQETAPEAAADPAASLSAEEFLSGSSETPPADEASAAPAGEAAPSPFDDVAGPKQFEDMKLVRLRTVDKLAARTHTFEIPVDKTVKFGKSLFIKARACRKSSPLDEPENAAFLQIWERVPTKDGGAEQSRWIFSGWMFSSNPSLSSMEHTVYDVWVIECKNTVTAAKSEAYSSEQAPAAAPEDQGTPAADAEGDEAAKTDEAPVATKEPEEKPATPASADMAPTAPVSGGGGSVPTLQEMPGSFEEAAEDTGD